MTQFHLSHHREDNDLEVMEKPPRQLNLAATFQGRHEIWCGKFCAPNVSSGSGHANCARTRRHEPSELMAVGLIASIMTLTV